MRAEIDLKAREWRLPGSRTKNGHPHVVPLSDLAIEIIKEATAEKQRGGGKWFQVRTIISLRRWLALADRGRADHFAGQ